VPFVQAQEPKFKCQYHQKKKKKEKEYLTYKKNALLI
jgi:hypothetical protein